MAGIDKTYIGGDEYIIYRRWWIRNYDKMIKEFSGVIWLYPFNYFNEYDIEITPEYLEINNQDLKNCKYLYYFPIWNTSERVDKWLIKNCDITSFRERMLDVYSCKWNGFKGQNWALNIKGNQKYRNYGFREKEKKS